MKTERNTIKTKINKVKIYIKKKLNTEQTKIKAKNPSNKKKIRKIERKKIRPTSSTTTHITTPKLVKIHHNTHHQYPPR